MSDNDPSDLGSFQAGNVYDAFLRREESIRRAHAGQWICIGLVDDELVYGRGTHHANAMLNCPGAHETNSYITAQLIEGQWILRNQGSALGDEEAQGLLVRWINRSTLVTV